MPGLPSWKHDHGQAIVQGSLSSKHPRFFMIDPLDSKSLLAMNSKLSSRWSHIVLRTFQLPCDQPSTSQLALLAFAKAHERSPTESFQFTPYSQCYQLGTPARHTKPIVRTSCQR